MEWPSRISRPQAIENSRQYLLPRIDLYKHSRRVPCQVDGECNICLFDYTINLMFRRKCNMMGPLNMHCNMVHYESKTGLELRGLYKAIRIVVTSLCQHPQLKLQKVLSRIR